MLDFNNSYISWLSFFLVAIIVSLLWLSVKLLFNYFLRSFSHTQKIVSINYLFFGERIFRMILAGILIMVFILVNPKVNGSLIAILLIISYSMLRDIFIGLSIILKLNLLRDNFIRSGDHQGTLVKLRWLGVMLKNNSSDKYVPYSYLYKHGFVQEENNYSAHLKFKSSDPVPRNILMDAIREKLFMLPFIAEDSKPDIHIFDQGIELNLEITNRKFEESIINAIEEIRLENTTIKAI